MLLTGLIAGPKNGAQAIPETIPSVPFSPFRPLFSFSAPNAVGGTHRSGLDFD
jgi:hypothetical protein